jgi:cytochrome P450
MFCKLFFYIIRNKIREEYNEIIKQNSKISQEIIKKLHYLDICFKEIGRLHAPFLCLRMVDDENGYQYGKYIIPKGYFIAVSIPSKNIYLI